MLYPLSYWRTIKLGSDTVCYVFALWESPTRLIVSYWSAIYIIGLNLPAGNTMNEFFVVLFSCPMQVLALCHFQVTHILQNFDVSHDL